MLEPLEMWSKRRQMVILEKIRILIKDGVKWKRRTKWLIYNYLFRSCSFLFPELMNATFVSK